MSRNICNECEHEIPDEYFEKSQGDERGNGTCLRCINDIVRETDDFYGDENDSKIYE